MPNKFLSCEAVDTARKDARLRKANITPHSAANSECSTVIPIAKYHSIPIAKYHSFSIATYHSIPDQCTALQRPIQMMSGPHASQSCDPPGRDRSQPSQSALQMRRTSGSQPIPAAHVCTRTHTQTHTHTHTHAYTPLVLAPTAFIFSAIFSQLHMCARVCVCVCVCVCACVHPCRQAHSLHACAA